MELCDSILQEYQKSLDAIAHEDKQLRESEYCHICKDGGELLCCEGCPKVYHASCLLEKDLITMEQLDSDDDWYCPSCMKKKKADAKAEALRKKQIKAAAAKIAKNQKEVSEPQLFCWKAMLTILFVNLVVDGSVQEHCRRSVHKVHLAFCGKILFDRFRP